MKVGIVGMGFVGSAVLSGFDHSWIETVCVDKDPAKQYTSTIKDLYDCDGIFVCVPSPQKDDGSCDTSTLEDVLSKLGDYKGVIISKVTAPPDVYRRLNNLYPNLVHSPEFLTAANAQSDYLNSTFCIIGGDVGAYRNEAERIIKQGQTQLKNIFHCKIEEASLAKYTINSFLASKVVFMNEIYQLSLKSNVNYKILTELISADERIGDSHLMVPGPDGSLGFGGYCFPKDTSAILKYANSVGVNLNMIDTAVKKNTILRLSENNN